MLNLSLLNQILITNNPQKKYLIAYSGGLDSTALLHLLVTLREQDPTILLTAIHVNHHLSPNAEQWVQHCLQICSQLKVPCIIENVQAKSQIKESPEQAARDARYAALAQHLSSDTVLLTAHTQDDQAETVLLQLLRGSGVKGLSAMPLITPFAKSYLLRPLLATSRAELLSFVLEKNLLWIEDESNQQLRYDRNYIRHQIMPLLQKRWPEANKTLSRAASHCASADQLLVDLAEQDWSKCKGNQVNTLSCQKLLALTEARRFNVLRYWLQSLQFPLPSTIKLKKIQAEVLFASADAEPLLCWDEVEVRRYRDDLYALPIAKLFENKVSIDWNLQSELKLPAKMGTLIATSQPNNGLYLPPNSKISIRFRTGGERCHPLGRSGSHPLKKLMQEWAIPPWQRDHVPLLFVENELVAVVGYCIAENWQAQEGQIGWNFNIK